MDMFAIVFIVSFIFFLGVLSVSYVKKRIKKSKDSAIALQKALDGAKPKEVVVTGDVSIKSPVQSIVSHNHKPIEVIPIKSPSRSSPSRASSRASDEGIHAQHWANTHQVDSHHIRDDCSPSPRYDSGSDSSSDSCGGGSSYD